VTEAGVSLSADSDCNEQRAATLGQRNFENACFLAVRRFWRERRYIYWVFFHNIFTDTRKLPVVKQANLHDTLSSCLLLLFVAVNILENPDASFNSTSKPSPYLPLFSDRKSDLLSVVNWNFNLVSKEKKMEYFFSLYAQSCRLEKFTSFFSAFITHIFSKLKRTNYFWQAFINKNRNTRKIYICIICVLVSVCVCVSINF